MGALCGAVRGPTEAAHRRYGARTHARHDDRFVVCARGGASGASRTIPLLTLHCSWRWPVVQVWLVLCIRAAYFVPLPGFSAARSRAGVGNVVDLLMPTDLGDLTGAWQCVHARA